MILLIFIVKTTIIVIQAVGDHHILCVKVHVVPCDLIKSVCVMETFGALHSIKTCALPSAENTMMSNLFCKPASVNCFSTLTQDFGAFFSSNKKRITCCLTHSSGVISQIFCESDQRCTACFHYFWLSMNMPEMPVFAYCKIEKKH